MGLNKSVALTNMPVEFINLQPINPLISSCDIKVLYTGKNRNFSYISKPVANMMANSLPNIPIVGEFLEEVEDFGDHGQELIINSRGIKFVKKTSPYGVVPADTKVWWQWFTDADGVQREYMMCHGYLWTGRYPQTARILEKGNGQSMELDNDSLLGEWAKLQNEEDEYFIINEAIFSALCILGENVEPCFESASITAPGVMYSLNKDEFKQEFNKFMFDLKDALTNEKGGDEMEDNKITDPVVEDLTLEPEVDHTIAVVEDEPIVEPGQDSVIEDTEPANTDEEEVEDLVPDTTVVVEDEPVVEVAEVVAEVTEPVAASYNLDEVVEYSELMTRFSALQEAYTALEKKYGEMEPEFNRLREVESAYAKQDKEAMIAKFNMLDEEDIADVRANIDNYSLDDIEAKLAVIAVRKKVNFNLENELKNDNITQDDIIAFNVHAQKASVPNIVKVLNARRKTNN